MSEVERLSESYYYDAEHHDFDSWWRCHRAMLANMERRNQVLMVIRNGNSMDAGMTLKGWLAAGGASRSVNKYITHSRGFPKRPLNIRPTPLSEYPS